jgi:hypothetical protein
MFPSRHAHTTCEAIEVVVLLSLSLSLVNTQITKGVTVVLGVGVEPAIG